MGCVSDLITNPVALISTWDEGAFGGGERGVTVQWAAARVGLRLNRGLRTSQLRFP